MERLALALILVFAPHTKIPIAEWIYPFRPADFILMAGALLFIRWEKRYHRLHVAVPEMLLVFFVALASVLWGYYRFNLVDYITVSEAGELVQYYWIPIKKMILIVICFLGFQFVVSTLALPNRLILKYWQRGLWIAVLLHSLTYLGSDDYFAVRAGVFIEGNYGGSYYLLSFFLMWHAKQQGLKFGGIGMFLALFGVALSQSTASLVLLLPLAIVAYLALPTKARKIKSGGITVIMLVLAAGFGMASMFGDEILNKLTTEEINLSSFSRYDRVASVKSGLDMFLANPIFGVGIQGYAFALPQFAHPFIESFFDWDSRRIANNIYAEILAEQGVVGFLVMALLVYRVCKPVLRDFRRNALLAIGAASIFLSWLAFPTYTVSFHWIGLAILVRVSIQGLGERSANALTANVNAIGSRHGCSVDKRSVNS